MLTYGDHAPPRSLSTLSSCVLSLGSFSKILAPGLRVGWIEGATNHVEHLGNWGVVASGGYMSHFSSCIVTSALELKLIDSHIANLRTVFAARCAALLNALRTHLPKSCVIPKQPSGGYFVWLELPAGISASALASELE